MQPLIDAVQQDALLIVLFGVGVWRILIALHKIDKRLVRVETQMGVKDVP